MAERKPVTLVVCRDFRNGRCSRGDLACFRAHPSPGMQSDRAEAGEVVVVCFDSLRNRCTRNPCRFYHPTAKQAENLFPVPSFPRASVPSQPAYNDYKVETYSAPEVYHAAPHEWGNSGATQAQRAKPVIEVCRDYMRQRCRRSGQECRYAHTEPTSGGNLATVCADFLRNKCQRPGCRYYHPTANQMSNLQHIPLNTATSYIEVYAEPYTEPYVDPYVEPYADIDAYPAFTECDDYYQPAPKRARYDQPGPAYVPNPHPVRAGYDDLGPAYRPTPQPYRHSSAEPALRGLLPSSEPAFSGNETLSVCFDFMRDRCTRIDNCRFAHPPPYVQVADNLVTICREARKGRCARPNCRYYHATALQLTTKSKEQLAMEHPAKFGGTPPKTAAQNRYRGQPPVIHEQPRAAPAAVQASMSRLPPAAESFAARPTQGVAQAPVARALQGVAQDPMQRAPPAEGQGLSPVSDPEGLSPVSQ